LTLDVEADSGEQIDPARRYIYIIERGPVPAEEAGSEGVAISGSVLLAMAADDWSAADTLAQGKSLMRRLIQHYLGGQALQSRRVFIDLQEI
jgi:DNA repair protein RecO (recombination protein O)